MQNLDKLARTLAGLVKQEKTKPYDATATVVKVEGGIAWIHIPGGVDRTPVEKTIDCKTGDRVTVRVSGGKAWITGNATAPPTDDRAANKAGETAKAAQKTAREALKIKQHFWTDDDGAHVTELEENTFRKNPRGGNALLDSHGLKIREGVDDIAHFERSEIRMNDEAGNPVFVIGMQGNGRMITQYPAPDRDIHFLIKPAGTFTVTAEADGVTETLTIDPAGGDIQTVDGDHVSITYVAWQSTTSGGHVDAPVISGYIGTTLKYATYTTSDPLPFFSLGSRDGQAGAYSATIGRHLKASQGLAIGKYNEDRTGALFTIGDGLSDNDRKNVLTVTNAEAEFEVEVEAPKVKSASYNLGKVIESMPSITVSTGNLKSAKLYQYGPVVMLMLTVNNDASVAAGGKVFLGKLNRTDLRPPGNVRSGSYYGSHCIGANISAAGDIVVQNASSGAMTASGSTTLPVCFTYLITHEQSEPA